MSRKHTKPPPDPLVAAYEMARTKMVKYADDEEGEIEPPGCTDVVGILKSYGKIVGPKNLKMMQEDYANRYWYGPRLGKALYEDAISSEILWAHQTRASRRIKALELKLDVLLDMKRMGAIDEAHGALKKQLRKSL